MSISLKKELMAVSLAILGTASSFSLIHFSTSFVETLSAISVTSSELDSNGVNIPDV